MNKDINNINDIKIEKNNIFNEVSSCFTHNLKKLIQYEGTQKALSKKIGISEDLLSKYKSSAAFPSIETLLYICKVYNFTLHKLLNDNLSILDIENSVGINTDIFSHKYYVYFLVTNKSKSGAIQEGTIEFIKDDVIFNIIYNNEIIKHFRGNYKIHDKLVFFNLHNLKDGNAYITMMKPNVNKEKYMGGSALMMLPSDANSKPCCQKILFSNTKIDRNIYMDQISSILNFNVKTNSFGNMKLSFSENEEAFEFITEVQE